jgi:hypothetical protein
MTSVERRRYPRIRFDKPIRGAVGATRVYVEDVSMGGLRIIHQAPLPEPRAVVRVDVPTEVGPISVDCEIVRTTTDRSLFHTGVQIVAPADRQSGERLRTLFTTTPKR